MTERKQLKGKERKAVQRALIERRHALSAAVERGLNAPPFGAMTSTADEEEACRAISDTELHYTIAGLHAATLSEVESALERIENGSYGRCEGCGRAIPKARMRVQPLASLCVKCQEDVERRAAFGSLGPAAVLSSHADSHTAMGRKDDPWNG